MTDRDALLALGERVEGASIDEQRALLIEAFIAILGPASILKKSGIRAWNPHWTRFNRMLGADAFESAAMMLVPEDMRDEIEITTLYCVARVTINMNHGDDGCPFYGSNDCNSISLAICAAALRATQQARP